MRELTFKVGDIVFMKCDDDITIGIISEFTSGTLFIMTPLITKQKRLGHLHQKICGTEDIKAILGRDVEVVKAEYAEYFI